jgi:histidine triad (HIT) family protein
MSDGILRIARIDCLCQKGGNDMAEKTIFKKIIDREIPAKIVYEDEYCLAFEDINPRAPTHLLVIPKKEIASVDEITEADESLIGHLFTAIHKIAAERGLANGYRVVANCGPDSGQEVPHLHFHVLGGRKLAWPPG